MARHPRQQAAAPAVSATSAADAGGSYRPGRQPLTADRPATRRAPAVAAVRQPCHGRVDLGEALTGLAQQRAGMLALERERGTLGIMLIVGASRTRLDDPGHLPLEPAQP